MKDVSNVIPFPAPSECFYPSGHKLSGGGTLMKVIHQHPTYTNEKERQERLQDLKKICSIKLQGLNNASRTA